MLFEQIKAQMFAAMKAGRVVEKEILKVAMGEISTDRERPGRTGSDEEALGLVKKLVKSIEETIAAGVSEDETARLREEISILSQFLPKALGLDEVVALLAPHADQLRAAPGDGAATGIAMKLVKAQGAVVDGKVVGEAVKRLRS